MIIRRIDTRRERREKKRVAAYCRVSTLLDAQQDSLETQTEYYSGKIRNNPDWEFAGIYSDERSGTDAKHRVGFQNLLKDAQDGKVDIILVKSISRFARNAADCLITLKILTSQGVKVIFEKEHIDSSDPSCFLYLSLMAAIAEDESRSISENIAWTNRQKVERGEYKLGSNRIMGYDSVDGTLVPNGDAPVIRFIFESFAAGVGYREISRRLELLGKHPMRSQRPFTASQLRAIVRNETYVGDKLLQKQAPKDFITKRPKKNVAYKSNYLWNDHEGIVSRELWDKVQERVKKDDDEVAQGIRRSGQCKNEMYGKVVCGCCGSFYRRRMLPTGRKVDGKIERHPVWMCAERVKGAKGNGCKNRNVREENLIEAFKAGAECITVKETGFVRKQALKQKIGE